MTRIVRGVFMAAVALLSLGSMSRAKDLTLDDCIDLALKNRASIIAARGNVELSKWSERTALGQFLPHASASYDYLKSQYRSGKVHSPAGDSTVANYDVTAKSMGVGASINMLLPDAIFNYTAARIDRFASQLDVIGSEQDLIFAVKEAFYSYLAAEQNYSVQQEAVKRSEEQLKLIQSRFELGSAALSDVLKQKVLYGNDKLALLAASNSITNSKANLSYTVGVDPQAETVYSSEYTVRQYDGTLDDAIKFGLEHKPSLLSQEKSISSANTRLLAAKWDYLPKLGPTASYGYSKTWAGGGFSETGTKLSYGFGLSWNIFDGFLRESRVASAKIARNNARAQMSDQRNQVVSQIKTAYLNIQQLKEQKTVSQANVDASTEDLKITQEKYNLGAATILDLLNAQVSLKQAQVTLIQADFDLNLAISRLENAMGKM
ncbi:MAG: TolC family protein [Candidatus Zixiibacteriota bacterium]